MEVVGFAWRRLVSSARGLDTGTCGARPAMILDGLFGPGRRVMSPDVYRDRREAGRVLAGSLASYAGGRDVLVLALPRGGVPVAYEVAEALGAPLDVYLVRKLGVPGHAELAFGAIATGGVRLLNKDVVAGLRIPPEVVAQVAADEGAELARREQAYRDDRPAPDVRGKTVIVIDDGLATGASMRAAVAALKREGPRRIVVAVPVAARSTCEELRSEVDDVVCARTPEPFHAVGLWYRDFTQTTDAEVGELLRRAERRGAIRAPSNSTGPRDGRPQGAEIDE